MAEDVPSLGPAGKQVKGQIRNYREYVSDGTIDLPLAATVTTEEIQGSRDKEMNPMFHIFKSIFTAVAMALLLGACSAVNWDYPRTPSNAFTHPETTSVGALFQEAADKHPGLSGFSLAPYGENAFLARLAICTTRFGVKISSNMPIDWFVQTVEPRALMQDERR